MDQKLNVVILDFDDNKSRIQLGLKQLSKHPWDAISETLKEGEKVKGKVVVIADYGAFVEIEEGVEGLVHVSVICLIPRDIFLDSRSIDKITASTSSPTFTKSCAERKCVDQDISET